MARGVFGDPGSANGLLDGALEYCFVKVVPAALAAHRVRVDPRGGEHPLPSPLPARG